MVISGTRDVAEIGPRKVITIDYPAPREELLVTPIELPTSEPGTPQITWTIAEDDMPVIGGVDAAHVTLLPFFYVAGTKPLDDFQTIAFRMYKNGVDVLTLDPTVDRVFWTLSLYPFLGIAPGDVIDVALWADVPGIMYDYTGLAILASRPVVAEGGTVLLDVAYTGVALRPRLTLGNPTGRFGPGAGVSSGPLYAVLDGDKTMPVMIFDSSGIDLYMLDSENTLSQTLIGDAEYRPWYQANHAPTAISYYPTSIRVTA